ncbi:MAG TPA: DUF401 family protein, partial [Anaerolineae bacterium]|nr:DUF401 family protein [Anaerolineae bacterium]
MGDFLKVLLVFAVIVVLARRKVNLGGAMVAAAILLGLLFKLSPGQIATVAVSTIVAPSTLNLAAALALVMFLEHIMRRHLIMRRMVDSLRGLVGDSRAVMAILPAVVGLLPSPGGALFSAPMVEEVSGGDADQPGEEELHQLLVSPPLGIRLPPLAGHPAGRRDIRRPRARPHRRAVPFHHRRHRDGHARRLRGDGKAPGRERQREPTSAPARLGHRDGAGGRGDRPGPRRRAEGLCVHRYRRPGSPALLPLFAPL